MKKYELVIKNLDKYELVIKNLDKKKNLKKIGTLDNL